MKKANISLHTIGELSHMCSVTRRMVLNYESHGLIKPIYTDEKTGYRYYGATSAARICHIKALQRLGFSLENINKFINGDHNVMVNHLSNLENMKAEIERQIYRTKALLTQPGDYSVYIETLPQADCIVQTKDCYSFQDRFMLLQNLTDYVFLNGWQVSNKGRSLISILHSVSEGSFYGSTSAAWALTAPNEHTVHFPETKALVINIKGPYSLISESYNILYTYAHEHNYTITGDLRIAFLTSPQSHTNTEDYVTQIFLPIA